MMNCAKCGTGTFGRLCGACKGEPDAVRRRWAEQNAMLVKGFKEGAQAALSGWTHPPRNPYLGPEGRSAWLDGFNKATKELKLLRKKYE